MRTASTSCSSPPPAAREPHVVYNLNPTPTPTPDPEPDQVATDIVLPGLGWISVVGSGECTISVEVPQGVVVSSREPMLSGAEHYRTTGVKFTGTKLTTKRGGTKRRR